MHEDALGPASEGFDDLALWTGSVARGDDGVWRMYYSALNSRGRGVHDQRIGMAESDDLMTWRRAAREPLVEPDPRYRMLDDGSGASETWRDPFVFRARRRLAHVHHRPRPDPPSGGRTAWSRTRAATTWSTGGSLRR